MRFPLLLLFLLGFTGVAFAQRQSLYVPPRDTDPAISTNLQSHYCVLNPAVPPKNRLFVFLPGTGGTPAGYNLVCDAAADQGFHVVGLNYPNDEAVNSLCGGGTDLDCYGNVRLETLDGTDRTSLVSVDRPNSIENRLAKVIAYLHGRFPNGGWGQFLETDGSVKWPLIVIAGHSQGGGHAGIIGRYRPVDRVIMYAALDYNVRVGRLANWIAFPQNTPNATPPEKFWGFIHQRDELVNPTLTTGIGWTAYGMSAFGPVVNVDSAFVPFSGTHSLTSNLDLPDPNSNFHGMIVVDARTPRFGDGTPVYKPVWDYLLTGKPATTVGAFRPANGFTYLRNSNTGGFADREFFYGTAGDIPVAGDWDGDGRDSIGIYRNGTFFLRNSNNTGFADLQFVFGQPGDVPVAGDWDGDGVDTIGVFRGGRFFLRNSNSSGVPDLDFFFGTPTDIPIVGDWDGNGTDTVGAFRPTNGFVYLRYTNTQGFADVEFFYGQAGDRPVVGDWNGDGVDTIAIYRAVEGTPFFYLRNSNATGFADVTFPYGSSGDLPIAGYWGN
jgi:hypothetical protein